MPTYSQLISYKLDRDTNKTESIYFTKHSSRCVKLMGKRGYSILDQNLVITGNSRYGGYTAKMDMDGFPDDFGTEREAALKLAEWMQRMGAAIEDHWSKP